MLLAISSFTKRLKTMSSLKHTAKLSKLAQSASGSRAFGIAATKPLQSKSKKEEEELDAIEKTQEAAEAIKSGAKEVRETCEFMRDTVETTAKTVNKMTKEATEKVSNAADSIKDKAKGSVSGALGIAQIIKDKVSGD